MYFQLESHKSEKYFRMKYIQQQHKIRKQPLFVRTYVNYGCISIWNNIARAIFSNNKKQGVGLTLTKRTNSITTHVLFKLCQTHTMPLFVECLKQVLLWRYIHNFLLGALYIFMECIHIYIYIYVKSAIS